MKTKPAPPPHLPPPPGPGRSESSPTARPDPFYSEPPTRQKNVTASVYQSLLSVFDEMSAEQRMEFVEFAARYAALEPAARTDLLELLPTYGGLAKSDRTALLDLATDLESTRRGQPRER